MVAQSAKNRQIWSHCNQKTVKWSTHTKQPNPILMCLSDPLNEVSQIKKQQTVKSTWGEGRNSSVDLSTPTILRSRVRTPSTPQTFLYVFIFCSTIFVIVLEKNENKQRGRVWSIFKKTVKLSYLFRGK